MIIATEIDTCDNDRRFGCSFTPPDLNLSAFLEVKNIRLKNQDAFQSLSPEWSLACPSASDLVYSDVGPWP